MTLLSIILAKVDLLWNT